MLLLVSGMEGWACTTECKGRRVVVRRRREQLRLTSGSRIRVQGVRELRGCGDHDVQVRRLLSVG